MLGTESVHICAALPGYDHDGGLAVVHRQGGLFDVDVDDLAGVDAADADLLTGDLNRALHADDTVHERALRVWVRPRSGGGGHRVAGRSRPGYRASHSATQMAAV